MGGCFSIESRRVNRSPNGNSVRLNAADFVHNNGASAAQAPAVANDSDGATVAVVSVRDEENAHSISPSDNHRNCHRSPSLRSENSNGHRRTSKSHNSTNSGASHVAGVSSSGLIAARPNGAVKPNAAGAPLKCEQTRWHSNDPLTASQLRHKRETFWDTAPTYEGRPEVWAALRAAARALEVQDFALTRAILRGAGVQLGPNGDLNESWDERGNYYRIPLYCLSPPTNLDADLSPSSSASSLITLDALGEGRRNGDANLAVEESVLSGNVAVMAHASEKQTSDFAATSGADKKPGMFDPVNMLNIKLRFHYVAALSIEGSDAGRSGSKNAEQLSTQPTTKSSSQSRATIKNKNMEDALVSAGSTSAFKIPSKDAEKNESGLKNNAVAATASGPTIINLPIKDVKFPVSSLEMIASAKRRVRDKYLQLVLPTSSDWRVQHWFFAGRLLNDKQPINSICCFKAGFVIQVIIRERDLKQFQQNHHRPKPQRAAVASSSSTGAEKHHSASIFGNQGSISSKFIVVARPSTPVNVAEHGDLVHERSSSSRDGEISNMVSKNRSRISGSSSSRVLTKSVAVATDTSNETGVSPEILPVVASTAENISDTARSDFMVSGDRGDGALCPKS